MTEKLDWEAPPLSSEDARLIDAYVDLRRPLDELPYTREFDQLISKLALSDTLENRHSVFKRLLTLRKMGRLPRIGFLAE